MAGEKNKATEVTITPEEQIAKLQEQVTALEAEKATLNKLAEESQAELVAAQKETQVANEALATVGEALATAKEALAAEQTKVAELQAALDAAAAPVKDKKPVSSLSTKKEKQGAELCGKTATYNGKTYAITVPMLSHKGKKYSDAEAIADAELVKFLVEETMDRQGKSSFIKEVFEA